jgi:hypothetical protein
MSTQENVYYLIDSKDKWRRKLKIGERSFNYLYTDSGWNALKLIVKNGSDQRLQEIKVKDQYNHEYSIEDFVNEIKNLIIMEN